MNSASSFRYMRSGKAKDIFELDGETLLMVFTDRISAYDIMLADKIPMKGVVMCELSAYCFEKCEDMGIPTHFMSLQNRRKMVVKRLDIIPVEVILRNYVYGSYWSRLLKGEIKLPSGFRPSLAEKLPEPIVEFTTKFEVHDRPVSIDEILDKGWVSGNELDRIVEWSLKMNSMMGGDAERGGLILADFKLEFGRFRGGLALADEAETPDVCRFWDAKSYAPGKPQKDFDKQVVRDYLAEILGWPQKAPPPGSKLQHPVLPEEVVTATKLRYIEAYERLTGRNFEPLDEAM